MARIIYWAALLAILAVLAAVFYYGGSATADLLRNDIGIGFDAAVTVLALAFVAVIVNRVIGRLFPAWHLHPSRWGGQPMPMQQQPQWQQPQPRGPHWGGQ
jgi:hypothetical protein